MLLKIEVVLVLALAARGRALATKDLVGCGVVSGACETGSYLHEISAASLSECQDNCEDNPECGFYTYHSANEMCIEFTECHDFSSDYCSEECQSGSVECICSSSGECRGESIGASFVNLNSCIEACYDNADCNWWNHDPSDDFCIQLFNCSTIDYTCTHCQHGEKACFEQNMSGYDVLLVTGGVPASGPSGAVDVIPLDSPELACPDVPDMPYSDEYGHAFLHERQPVVCAQGSNRKCYKFNTATWEWEDYVDTKDARNYAAGAALGKDYMLLGGAASADSTETFSAATETWNYGPDIPYRVWVACATAYKNDQVILTGGYQGGSTYLDTAAVLNVTSGSWSYLPDFNKAREYHACGIATAADGSSSLVVAGGYRNSQYYSDIEIFDLDSGATSWRAGVAFPNGAVQEAYSLPYKNTFLVIGGSPDDAVELTSIWEYDPDNPTAPWILRPEELSVGRQNSPVALLMKAADLDCTVAR